MLDEDKWAKRSNSLWPILSFGQFSSLDSINDHMKVKAFLTMGMDDVFSFHWIKIHTEDANFVGEYKLLSWHIIRNISLKWQQLQSIDGSKQLLSHGSSGHAGSSCCFGSAILATPLLPVQKRFCFGKPCGSLYQGIQILEEILLIRC